MIRGENFPDRPSVVGNSNSHGRGFIVK